MQWQENAGNLRQQIDDSSVSQSVNLQYEEQLANNHQRCTKWATSDRALIDLYVNLLSEMVWPATESLNVSFEPTSPPTALVGKVSV